ncbi:MAG TPA: arginine--tRNA ligase [Clostridia bacterium]|nr:arginine--tRNA ligase [Clostridia bacterium]
MNLVAQLEERIYTALREAAWQAQREGELSFHRLPEFVLEVPRDKNHGDYATNLAMVLAREAKKPPRQIAEILVKHFAKEGTWVAAIEIAGPGFINFRLDHRWLYQVPPVIEGEDQNYGRSDVGQGRKVMVEFVSANPTGLLHMGNARGAALGDTIANLLDAAGFDVTREYYINDAGNQIENFGKSLEARYLQLLGHDVPFPEEGYHGEDIIETVKGIIARDGDKYLGMESSLRREFLIKHALEEKLSHIRQALANFGVTYDVWFSEQSLHDSGAVEKVIRELEAKGYVYEKDGALWLKGRELGLEKDEVLVRSNGIPTYYAADIAYHKNKLERGFTWLINLWGADHHSHVARMKAALKALGYDPEVLTVVVMQLVRLFSGGEIVRMSKRTGQYITLSDLMEEVGVDAARFFFVMRSADSHLDFDLDLAKEESSENPVYYVQYAHARICSILRQAEEEGIQMKPAAQCRLELLTHPAELELLRKMAEFPQLVRDAALSLEPHRLTHYAGELAGLFHNFYTHCRVLTSEADLRDARLVLVNSVRITLRNLLQLLGVRAPERM